MPISNFGEGLQKALSLLPGTYGTSLVKNHTLRGVFEEMKNSGVPSQVVDGIKGSIDCSFDFFGHDVSITAMYLVMIISVLALVGIYVLINVLRKNKI